MIMWIQRNLSWQLQGRHGNGRIRKSQLDRQGGDLDRTLQFCILDQGYDENYFRARRAMMNSLMRRLEKIEKVANPRETSAPEWAIRRVRAEQEFQRILNEMKAEYGGGEP